jgi:outer membrane biosynthesis protein TonB
MTKIKDPVLDEVRAAKLADVLDTVEPEPEPEPEPDPEPEPEPEPDPAPEAEPEPKSRRIKKAPESDITKKSKKVMPSYRRRRMTTEERTALDVLFRRERYGRHEN